MQPEKLFSVCFPAYFEPHPDTDPERIRQIHEDDVYHAHLVLGTIDADTISEWVCLPRWNCLRALSALGLIEFDSHAVKRHNGKVKPGAVNLLGTKPLAAVDAKR